MTHPIRPPAARYGLQAAAGAPGFSLRPHAQAAPVATPRTRNQQRKVQVASTQLSAAPLYAKYSPGSVEWAAQTAPAASRPSVSADAASTGRRPALPVASREPPRAPQARVPAPALICAAGGYPPALSQAPAPPRRPPGPRHASVPLRRLPHLARRLPACAVAPRRPALPAPRRHRPGSSPPMRPGNRSCLNQPDIPLPPPRAQRQHIFLAPPVGACQYMHFGQQPLRPGT